MRLALTQREVSESLAPWRSRYPKFGALLDEGASQLKAFRYLGLELWQDGRLEDAAGILQMAVTAATSWLISAACFARWAGVPRRCST
jgi:hypothetical protein